MALDRACSALSHQGDHERATRRVCQFLVSMIVSGTLVLFSPGGDAAICRIDFAREYNHTPFMGSGPSIRFINFIHLPWQ
jgi:hypothetical protein